MTHLTRRTLFAAAGTLAAAPFVSRAFAATPLLTVDTRTIEVKGRAARVFGVLGQDGRPGLMRNEGDALSGLLRNASAEELVMHWHGQVQAPALQDRARPGGGVLAAGATDEVAFPLTSGTHWMHSHLLNEQLLLAAPLVAQEADSRAMQNVTIMLHDFSFRSPQELLASLGGAGGHGAHGAAASAPSAHAGHGGHAGMNHGAMGQGSMAGLPAMPPMAHANDIAYDAFLANDRTLADPETVRVDKGAPVRLRLINGATATAFLIDTGALEAEVVAVDGSPCARGVTGRLFPLAQGQRLDLVVQVPASGGAFPVLAQVEGERARTGLILASAGANVARVSGEAKDKAALADLSLDARLAAATPLSVRKPDRDLRILLGEEPGYRWTLNGKVHGEHSPLAARVGERVRLTFANPTSMMHPMHLHGHHFQVVALDGKPVSGPLRDTVIVPPGREVSVAFDTDKPGDWYIHCHHLYHMATGMMTELAVTA